MRLKSIETTPNPNSMKLNLLDTVGAAITYTLENSSGCGLEIAQILQIEGVKNVFACNDFLTLNRDPRADWRPILEQASAILGGNDKDAETGSVRASEEAMQAQRQTAQEENQIHIFVQTFRGIPIQVKAVAGLKDVRISLGDRFNEAAQAAQIASGADYLKERYWADHGVRYGPLEEVAEEVADELRGSFDQERLAHAQEGVPSMETISLWLNDSYWHKRLAAVQVLSSIDNSVKYLAQALKDENPQVRRLAAAALGTTGSAEAVEPLAHTLINDQHVGVRRTAGDALSDLGDVSAQDAICKALGDPNKLVRWRAARFLADIGTEEALPFLEAAIEDPEFEVRLEVEAAIQRIHGGGLGMGPAWKRIIGGAQN